MGTGKRFLRMGRRLIPSLVLALAVLALATIGCKVKRGKPTCPPGRPCPNQSVGDFRFWILGFGLEQTHETT
jgi:hypothetical protein